MSENCPDPRFPIENRLQVLRNTGLDGKDSWEISGGWSSSGGRFTALNVTNGIHFRQKSGKFLFPYGAGENKITQNDVYFVQWFMSNDEDSEGKIRPVWGGNVGKFVKGVVGGGFQHQRILAPGNGDFQLAVQSGANVFSGFVSSVSLYTYSCVAESQEDGGGNGFGVGEGGDVGGAIILSGETPQTGFSNKFQSEKQESFRTDMGISPNEINDDFDRNLIGGA